jgi:hypothetical protein
MALALFSACGGGDGGLGGPLSYTVNFSVTGYGGEVPSKNAYLGEKLAEPAAPIAPYLGLEFDGWYTNPDCETKWNFASDTVQADTTLYARWITWIYDNEADPLRGLKALLDDVAGNPEDTAYLTLEQFDDKAYNDYLMEEIFKCISDSGVTNPVELNLSSYQWYDSLFDPDEFDTFDATGLDKVHSLVLPNDCTKIKSQDGSDSLFDVFTSLSSVTSYKVTELTGYTFYSYTTLESIDMPELTTIGTRDFAGCIRLSDVTIPKLTTIGDSAFVTCEDLQNMVLPASVTTIGDSAFENCTDLQTMDLPASVTSIGDEAFRNCGTLKLTCRAPTPPALGNNVFRDTTINIYVPAQSVDAYKKANGWKDYARIFAIP